LRVKARALHNFHKRLHHSHIPKKVLGEKKKKIVVLCAQIKIKQEKTMAKSQATFGKKDKERNRQKARQEKEEKMAERKANAKKGKSLDEMMAYIDEHGNISSTPPDPNKKRVFDHSQILVSVPKQEDRPQAQPVIRKGTISFFNTDKGFGFIKDNDNGESIFVHASQSSEQLSENDVVNFEVEMGPRGSNAVRVSKVVAA
jgi:cold shock CspA family protein